MTTRPHPSTPVRSDAELTERWRALLELDGPPSRRSLFLAWLRADGAMVPLLIPVEDVTLEPDRAALATLVELHTTVAESDGAEPDELHLAMLLERDGAGASRRTTTSGAPRSRRWYGTATVSTAACTSGTGAPPSRSFLGEHGRRPEPRSTAVTC